MSDTGKKRYVYKLTFPNGMVYIGVAHSVEDRWANNGIHYRKQAVYTQITKYGWDNIKKEVVLYLPNDEKTIKAVERELIRAYKDRCYNLASNPVYIERHRPVALRRMTHMWTINGITMPGRDWCRLYNRDLGSCVARIRRWGMTPLEALTCPVTPSNLCHDQQGYWRKVNFVPGADTTSYVTPYEEWPEEYRSDRHPKA